MREGKRVPIPSRAKDCFKRKRAKKGFGGDSNSGEKVLSAADTTEGVSSREKGFPSNSERRTVGKILHLTPSLAKSQKRGRRIYKLPKKGLWSSREDYGPKREINQVLVLKGTSEDHWGGN